MRTFWKNIVHFFAIFVIVVLGAMGIHMLPMIEVEVKAVEEQSYQARIGNTNYVLLQDALAVAQNGDKVELIENTKLLEALVIPENVIFTMTEKVEIVGGEGGLINYGIIEKGTFDCTVLHYGDIFNGVFKGRTANHGKIYGGNFMGVVVNATGSIYGGTFTGGIIEEGGVIVSEAIIGNTYYATIEDALNMSKAGDNVTLIRSAILDSNATINAGVTLTIASGKTLTIEKGAVLTNNGSVIFDKESEIKNKENFICNNHIGGKATCTKKAVCDLCKKEYGERLAHIGGKATCVEKAVCEVCNESYGEVDSINGHQEELLESQEPTCTEKGLTEGKKCPVCGETLAIQNEIPALGHTEEIIKGYEATCTENGLTDGLKCSICDEMITAQTVIIAKGHIPNEDDGDCTTAIHCSICDAVTLEKKAEHTYGEWTVTKEATATEKGSKEKTCSVCGDIRIEEIPATGKIEESNNNISIEKKGCFSSIGSDLIGVIPLISAMGVLLFKREKEERQTM